MADRPVCVVPGCGDLANPGDGYCVTHGCLIFDFTGWLYGWALKTFDFDRRVLDRART